MVILSASRRCVNAGILCLAFFFLACPAAAPPPADHFVVGIENAPSTFDPRRATDAYSSKISRLIYSGLFQVNEKLDLTPDLIATYQVLSPTQYRFHLKPNVRFHNGQILTAADVIWTYNSIRQRKVVSPHYSVFSKIATMTSENEQTITITLKEPFAPFLAALTMGILPAETEKMGIGTGPFILAKFVPEEKVILKKFPTYHQGPVRPGQVTFRVIREDNLRVLELVRGRLDLIQNAIPAALIPYLQQQKELRLETETGINYSYLGFNLEEPHLHPLKVRRAIAHAIDRKKIIEYKLHGLARPASSLLTPVHWAYQEPGIDYPYNPDKARRLLDEAGFPDPDGPGPKKRFRLYYKTSTQRDRVGLARLIATYLNEVGIEVLVTPFEWGTLFRDIRNGNFQLYSLTWVGVTDPDIYYYIFHSSQIPPHGGNRNRYLNPAIDQLTSVGRKTLDRFERKEIYAETQKIVARELPYVNLWYENNTVARRKEVQGYQIYPNASFMGLTQIYRVAETTPTP